MYQDHQKVGERKKLKKVKKQWVVASTALFAFVGAAALTTTTVSADEVNNNTEVVSTQNTDKTKSTDQTQTTDTQTETEGLELRGALEENSNPAGDRDQNNGNNNQVSPEEAKQKLIDEVVDDFLSGRPLKSNPSDDYLKYWNILKDFSAEYNAKINGYGTSTEDYTSFKATDKNNVAQSKQEADDYEAKLKAKFINDKNVSVHGTDKDALNAQDFNNSSKKSEDADFFNSYIIKQGIADAESGRFNGHNTADKAIVNISNDKNDAYSQAYLGAQAAMAAQWNNDKDLKNPGTLQLLSDDKYTAAYLAGYNDVVKRFNDGTVFVANADQFNTAFTGDGHTIPTGGQIQKNRTAINLTNDIDFGNRANGTPRVSVTGSLDRLTIDGQNHMMDLHGVSYTIGSGSSQNLMIKNFQLLAGTNYYGPFCLQGGNAYYSNVNYTGSQLLSSAGTNVDFSGNINVFSIGKYTTPFSNNVATQGSNGNQENLEISNLTVQPGTSYFGTTESNGVGNTVIKMKSGGNFLMGDSSVVTLVPRGNGGQDVMGSSSWGVANAGGTLKLQNNASLTIVPEASTAHSYETANGIYLSGGTVEVNGGEINVLVDGPSAASNTLVYAAGGSKIYVKNGGRLNIIVKNLGNRAATNGILRNDGGKINILDQGTVNLSADGSGNVVLLNGQMAIVNPGKEGVVFDLKDNTNNSSKLASNQISGSSVRATDDPSHDFSEYAYTIRWQNGKWTLIDKNKKKTDKSDVNQYLKIADSATTKFTSPLNLDKDKKKVSGYLSVQNYTPEAGDTVYIQLSTGSDTDINKMTAVDGSVKSNNPNDDTKYMVAVKIPAGYKGQALRFEMDLPENYKSENIGVRANYSVSTSVIVKDVTKDKDTTKAQAINADGDKLDFKGDSFDINTIDNANVKKAKEDAQKDLETNTDDNREKDLYVNDENYKASYDSYKEGYKAAKNGGAKTNTPEVPANSGNAQSFTDGYKKIAGVDIDSAKKTARDAIDKALKETEDAINNDNALPQADKDAQKKAAQQKADKAKENINKVDTVDDINKAQKKGEEDVKASHVPYSLDLDGQKNAAKDAVKKALDATNKLIDDDPTLTPDQKNDQKKAAKDAADDANKAIDDAKDSDAVTAAQKDSVPKIFDAHKADKNGIPAHQSAAKAALKEALKNTKAAIDADPTLTDDAKKQQKEDAEKAETAAEKNVDSKDNVTDILKAQTDGVKDIDSKHVVNTTPVPAQKSAAKAAIDEALKNTEAAIDNDPTLTPDQKDEQKKNARAAAKNAKDEIDKISDTDPDAAQKIVNKQNDGAKDIHDQHKSADLGAQKSSAKAAAKKALEDTNAAIDADPTLTPDEKDDQKKNAAAKEDEVEKKIDAADTADDVLDAQNKGVPDIYKEHQEHNPNLPGQKTAAKAAVQQALDDTKNAINNDGSLSDDAKAEQISKAEAAAENAFDAIDEAEDAKSVIDNQQRGVDNVKKAHTMGASIDDQKDAAKKALDEAFDKTKAAIEADPSLTDAEKQDQIRKAGEERDKAKEKIGNVNAADSNAADQIRDAQQSGVNDVLNQHQQAKTDVQGQKNAAKAAIDDARKQTKAAIDADSNLTQSEKDAQTGEADREANDAIQAIDQVGDGEENAAETIKNKQKAAVPAVYGKHVTSDLDAQKQAARAAVEDARAKANAAIDADPTLDTTAKTSQKNAVDDEAKKAIDNIDHHSESADELANHQKEDIPAIHVKHEVNKDDVPAQKLAAHAAVKDALDKTKAAIDGDPTLTTEEKNKQKQDAADAAKQADDDIEKATNAQGIEDAEKKDLPEIFGAHQHAKDPLPAQRVAGNGSIDEALDKMKAEIDADSTLDDDEKAEQKHDAEEAARRAKDNIEAATDADGIIMAQKIGVAAISHVHRAHVEKPKPAQPVAPVAPAAPVAPQEEVKHAQPETAKEAASQALSSIWMLAVAATGFVLSKAKKDAK